MQQPRINEAMLIRAAMVTLCNLFNLVHVALQLGSSSYKYRPVGYPICSFIVFSVSLL